MQDAAMFFRNRAVMCFHRRRRWPFLSDAWRHEVEDARRFIRACRANWQYDQPHEILRTVYALGPRVRTQKSGRAASNRDFPHRRFRDRCLTDAASGPVWRTTTLGAYAAHQPVTPSMPYALS